MGATVEEIMAVSLAQQITRRFDLTRKAGGNPAAGGDSSAEQPFRQ
jgi:hypothetical protein